MDRKIKLTLTSEEATTILDALFAYQAHAYKHDVNFKLIERIGRKLYSANTEVIDKLLQKVEK